jgi:peptidoglycan/LPS O-acetylase OafA/YrhL
VILGPLIIYLYNHIELSFVPILEQPRYLYYYLFMGNFNTINTGIWPFPFAHLWSICIEEHFYIVWPLLLFLIPKKYFYHTVVILILCSILARVYFFLYSGNYVSQLYLNTICKMDTLLIGAIFAKLHLDNNIKFKLNKLLLSLLILFFIYTLSMETWVSNPSLFSEVFKSTFIYCLQQALSLVFYLG